jgi:peroxin-10
MNDIKNNLDSFTLLTTIYDIESNILSLIKDKIQNFILSINKLFVNNNWYNNHIIKYINFIFSKKILPIIISGIMYIKSKISSFQLLSEEYLNINIRNKNKFIFFLLLNSFEALIIKYVNQIFAVCYSLIFKSRSNNLQKITYYGKCIKNILKHIKNLQNIILGMIFLKSVSQKENNSLFNNLKRPLEIISYGFIFKNAYNIYQNIINIFNIYCIEEEKEGKLNEKRNNLSKNNNEDIKEINNVEDDDNENMCILCLNKYNKVSCTPCGHLFCWSCIHLYLAEKNNCPKCKSSCKPQEILFLQNYLNF